MPFAKKSVVDFRAFEYIFLACLVTLSVILQRVLTSGCCVGPDLVAYLEIAQMQATQQSFWTSPEAFKENFWAMGYPTALHYILSLSGDSLVIVQWIQMVMAASLGIGAWFLAFRMGIKVRLLAASIVALSPNTFWTGNSFGYEILLAWLLTFSLSLSWWASRNEGNISIRVQLVASGIAGLLLGLGVLTQSRAIVVTPVIFYLLWRNSRARAWWGLAGFLIATIPWALRNLFVLGTPNIFTGNGAYNLWIGNNPETTNGGSMMRPLSMPAGSSEQLSQALTFIISQPEIAINFVFRKTMRMWEPLYLYPELIAPGIGRTLIHVATAALSVLILVGFLVFLGGRLFTRPPTVPDVAPLAVFVLLFYLSHLPFIAEPRFMASVYPVTAVVSVSTLFALVVRFRKLRQR